MRVWKSRQFNLAVILQMFLLLFFIKLSFIILKRCEKLCECINIKYTIHSVNYIWDLSHDVHVLGTQDFLFSLVFHDDRRVNFSWKSDYGNNQALSTREQRTQNINHRDILNDLNYFINSNNNKQ